MGGRKMIAAYKAPIDPKVVGAILDYLASVKGVNWAEPDHSLRSPLSFGSLI
jgi:hypothetical protein